jgi:hypothetical protein
MDVYHINSHCFLLVVGLVQIFHNEKNFSAHDEMMDEYFHQNLSKKKETNLTTVNANLHMVIT